MSALTIAASLLYLVNAGGLAFTAVRVHKGRDEAETNAPQGSDFVHAALFAALSAGIGVWMLVWPTTASLPALLVGAGAIGACGLLALRRRALVAKARDRWGQGWVRRLPWRHLMLMLAALLAVSTLEVAWNVRFPLVRPYALGIEWLLVLLPIEAAYHLALRRGGAATVVVAACSFIGILQAFILDFKTSLISIADVYALGTALSVSGGYAYPLGSRALESIALACAGALCCLLASDLTRTRRPRQAATSFGVGVAAAAALVAAVTLPDYQMQLKIDVNYWWDWQLLNHQTYCFLPAFVAEAQKFPIRQPEGYSPEAADEAEKELGALYEKTALAQASPAAQAQWEELKPSVVVVMNETFTDLSMFGELGGYTGPAFFNGLEDALDRGKLAVSVYAGGTCNTEFEFLTGQSMAFVGNGKYPYSLYSFEDASALPKQLAALGYHATAIHPNVTSNWNRDRVYKEMGFEDFLSIDDFEGAEQFHNNVSDAATYERIVELLKGSDEPQLVFDVTMQNHSGYDQGGIPEETMAAYRGFGDARLDDETNTAIAEYTACIGESDRALEWLVGELRALDRPVVLVFFGDHQPYFTTAINDALHPDEEMIEHTERLYVSDYLVWANYDIAGPTGTADFGSDCSASDLGTYALAMAGFPLSGYQESQLGAHTLVSQLNLFGYRGRDGAWRDLGDGSDAAATEALRKLGYLSYREFGSLV